MNNNALTRSLSEIDKLQLIETKRKKAAANSATLLNQNLKKSIGRFVLESDAKVGGIRKIARLFQVSEGVVVDVIRERHRDLVNAASNYRRLAA